jgi:hypothetical protein
MSKAKLKTCHRGHLRRRKIWEVAAIPMESRKNTARFLRHSDYLRKDPVTSEPFSAKFPVTGKNTGNFGILGRIQLATVPPETHSKAILQYLRPWLMEKRTGNSNRHNKD